MQSRGKATRAKTMERCERQHPRSADLDELPGSDVVYIALNLSQHSIRQALFRRMPRTLPQSSFQAYSFPSILPHSVEKEFFVCHPPPPLDCDFVMRESRSIDTDED